MKKYLVITDAQNEFVTGALGNEECVKAVPNIVDAVNNGEYSRIFITKDTHTNNYLNTQEGRRLPVLHGQEGSEGYELNADIAAAVEKNYTDKQVKLVKKPTFGSLDFGNAVKAAVEEDKKENQAEEIEIHFTGFCTGICVLSNVVMAKTFCPEERVCVIENACACVTPDTHKTAIEAMKTIQVDII